MEVQTQGIPAPIVIATLPLMPAPNLKGATPTRIVVKSDSRYCTKPTTTTPGTINLAWYAMSGLLYQVQYKTNLSQTTWGNLGGSIIATNASLPLSVSDTIGPNPQRFYRLSVSLP